jgi:CDP-diacylglycerol--glycerol-3-phosphate 3-phosphatidyltransferase
MRNLREVQQSCVDGEPLERAGTMVTVYDLKPAFQRMMSPVTQALATRSVHPDAVTGAAIVISVSAGALVAFYAETQSMLLVLSAAMFIRLALNAIDGELARLTDRSSRHGAVLNDLEILLSDAALYLPLAALPGISAAWVMIAVGLGFAVEIAGMVWATRSGAPRHAGPMTKPDRALAFGLLAVVLGLGVAAGPWVDWAMLAVITLLIMTFVNRVRGRGGE